MSILDDTKRAQKGAGALLKLITDSKPDTFESLLDEYTRNDGIFGSGFLETFDKARSFLLRLGGPGSETEFFQFPFEFQMAFVEWVIRENRFDFLQTLMDAAGDKNLKKILKRRIHELKSHGVALAEPRKKGGFKFKPVVDPEPSAIISESTSMGEREIFYAARSFRGGIRMLYAVTHFSDGIVDFNVYETSRSGLRDMIKSLRSESNLEIFEVDQPLAYHFLESAKKRNESSGRPLPSRFITIFQEFNRPEGVPSTNPVFDHISPREVEDRFSDYLQSDQLHNSIELRHWMLPKDLLQKVDQRLTEIEYSMVLIDRQQKEEVIAQLITDTINEYFSEKTRKVWITRLEESALLLALKGMKETALLTLTVAKALEQPGRIASSIPFCDGLLRKLIRAPESEEETVDDESESGSGKIILP